MKIFRVLAIVFALFFAFAMVVQFNDPDAINWILIYCVAFLASIGFLIKNPGFWVYVVLAVLFVGLGVYYWPDIFEGVALDQGMKTENIEKGRESLGSFISAVAMGLFAIGSRKRA